MKKKHLIITILLIAIGLIVINYSETKKSIQVQNLHKKGINRYGATLVNNTRLPVTPHIAIQINDHITKTKKNFNFKINKIESNEVKDIEFTIDERNKHMSLRTVSVLLNYPTTIASRSITDIALPDNKFSQLLTLSPFVFGVSLLVISKLV